jgi:hypothetical protein
MPSLTANHTKAGSRKSKEGVSSSESRGPPCQSRSGVLTEEANDATRGCQNCSFLHDETNARPHIRMGARRLSLAGSEPAGLRCFPYALQQSPHAALTSVLPAACSSQTPPPQCVFYVFFLLRRLHKSASPVGRVAPSWPNCQNLRSLGKPWARRSFPKNLDKPGCWKAPHFTPLTSDPGKTVTSLLQL